MQKQEVSPSHLTNHNFTQVSEDTFYDAVDVPEFIDGDAEAIFAFLKSKVRVIPFCDYLRRYIYLKQGMTKGLGNVELQEFQQIIKDSFTKTGTPKSFSETKTKIGALTKNWLTQTTVNRSIVFLLGFGLGMTVDEVSDLLIKALRERDFNFKDPVEVIYWYCYKNNYNFDHMQALKQRYEMDEPTPRSTLHDGRTILAKHAIFTINDDDTLIAHLRELKGNNNVHISVTAREWFHKLYMQCKQIIADFYNADKIEEQGEGELKDEEKLTAENITEADVERVLCCGTPFNNNGNLEGLVASELSKYFVNRRPSRQHLNAITSNETAVDRFDLITLNFFLFSQNKEYDMKRNERYVAFVDSTNAILNDCMMGELYIANPYECFLLMCIVSDHPLGTFADVWEISFT